ncbi:MAG: hypothetical protein LBE98_03350 [Puniceicoccales bacterium]|nr:hypothetical protein [Puniceicoccales bacterium]
MNISQSQSQSQVFAEKILEKEALSTQGDDPIFDQLNRAFESVENLNDFAKNVLGLDFDESEGFGIQAGDLAGLKTVIMADLASARAENHGSLNSTEGIIAWLRNAFMSFAMHMCARSNAEKLFEQNETTTKAMKDALGSISLVTNPPPEAPLEPPVSTSDVLPEDFEAVERSPEAQPTPLVISPNIVDRLQVIDTPRDGSCMLWSVLAGLPPPTEAQPAEASSEISADVFRRMAITGDQGRISNEKVLLARDTTIPELRQVISMGMIADRKDVAEARAIEGGGFGAKRITPEQMKYIAKHLQRDIAIITKQEGQSVAYLCTREGEVIISQNDNFSSYRDKFEAALQNGPAIFAEDNHARCVKYNAQVGE